MSLTLDQQRYNLALHVAQRDRRTLIARTYSGYPRLPDAPSYWAAELGMGAGIQRKRNLIFRFVKPADLFNE